MGYSVYIYCKMCNFLLIQGVTLIQILIVLDILTKIISHFKRLAITLMYCSRLHAWWSTQSRLATLLSSLIARRWVRLQTL